MKPKFYYLLMQCVEDGVSIGYHRAYKHTENPSADLVKEKIEDAVLNQLHEWFIFEDEYKD